MQLILITPDGAAKPVMAPQYAGGFLPAVRRHLGHGCQTAEPMFLGDKLTAWVDEDGLSKDLEPNPVGTSLLVGLVPTMAASLLRGGFVGSIVLSGGLDGDVFTGLPDDLTRELIRATGIIAQGFCPYGADVTSADKMSASPSEMVLGPDPVVQRVRHDRTTLAALLAGRDVQVWDGQPDDMYGQGTEAHG